MTTRPPDARPTGRYGRSDDKSSPEIELIAISPWWERFRDIDVRSIVQTHALRVSAVAGVVGFLVFVALHIVGGSSSDTSLASERTQSTTGSPSASTEVVVDVGGAVNKPGVYRLAPNARVQDAVRAAGGLTADADVTVLNQAAVIHDGDRVYVIKVGETPPAAGAGGTSGAVGAESGGQVNLNSATTEALDALPGIGPATAKAIVSYRDSHGPFHSVDDLDNVDGIGPSKLEKLRPLVTV